MSGQAANASGINGATANGQKDAPVQFDFPFLKFVQLDNEDKQQVVDLLNKLWEAAKLRKELARALESADIGHPVDSAAATPVAAKVTQVPTSATPVLPQATAVLPEVTTAADQPVPTTPKVKHERGPSSSHPGELSPGSHDSFDKLTSLLQKTSLTTAPIVTVSPIVKAADAEPVEKEKEIGNVAAATVTQVRTPANVPPHLRKAAAAAAMSEASKSPSQTTTQPHAVVQPVLNAPAAATVPASSSPVVANIVSSNGPSEFAATPASNTATYHNAPLTRILKAKQSSVKLVGRAAPYEANASGASNGVANANGSPALVATTSATNGTHQAASAAPVSTAAPLAARVPATANVPVAAATPPPVIKASPAPAPAVASPQTASRLMGHPLHNQYLNSAPPSNSSARAPHLRGRENAPISAAMSSSSASTVLAEPKAQAAADKLHSRPQSTFGATGAVKPDTTKALKNLTDLALEKSPLVLPAPVVQTFKASTPIKYVAEDDDLISMHSGDDAGAGQMVLWNKGSVSGVPMEILPPRGYLNCKMNKDCVCEDCKSPPAAEPAELNDSLLD